MTDYLNSRMYAGPLKGRMMRRLLEVSINCCEHFGTLACLDCPLEEEIPDAVPSCGARNCTSCVDRARCPCGNPEYRDILLEGIGVQFTLMSEQ